MIYLNATAAVGAISSGEIFEICLRAIFNPKISGQAQIV